VPEPGGPFRPVLTPAARADIQELLAWTREWFGEAAVARYAGLLKQALRDIAADPCRPGCRKRPELGPGIFTYHLLLSARAARSGSGPVKKPRHFLLYRKRGEKVVDVLRVLHDARDLERHLLPRGG
jgi:toxin ParE1/3/4